MNKNTEDAVNSMLSFLKVYSDKEELEDIDWRQETDRKDSFYHPLEFQENDSEDSYDLSLEWQKKYGIKFKDIYLECDAKEGDGVSEDIEMQKNDEGGSPIDLSLKTQKNNGGGSEDLKQQEKSIHDELQIIYDKFAEKYNDVKLYLLKFFLNLTKPPNHLIICYFMNKDIFMNTYYTISISHKGKITQRFKEPMDLKHLKEMKISMLLRMCDELVLGYKNLRYRASIQGRSDQWMLIKEIKYYSMSNVTKEYYFRNSERNLLICSRDKKDEQDTMIKTIRDKFVMCDLQQRRFENKDTDVQELDKNGSNAECKEKLDDLICSRDKKDGQDTMIKTISGKFEETTEKNKDLQQQRFENKDTDVQESDKYGSNAEEKLNDEEVVHSNAEMNLEQPSVESFQKVSDVKPIATEVVQEVREEGSIEEFIDKLISEHTQDMDEPEEMDVPEEMDEIDEIQDVDPGAKEVLEYIFGEMMLAEEKQRYLDESLDVFQKFVKLTYDAVKGDEKQCIQNKKHRDEEERIRNRDDKLEKETKEALKRKEESDLFQVAAKRVCK